MFIRGRRASTTSDECPSRVSPLAIAVAPASAHSSTISSDICSGRWWRSCMASAQRRPAVARTNTVPQPGNSVALRRSRGWHRSNRSASTSPTRLSPLWRASCCTEDSRDMVVNCRSRCFRPQPTRSQAPCLGRCPQVGSASLLAGKTGVTPALSRSCIQERTPIKPLVALRWCRWEGGQVGRSGSQNTREESAQHAGLFLPTIRGAKTPCWYVLTSRLTLPSTCADRREYSRAANSIACAKRDNTTSTEYGPRPTQDP